MTGMYIIKTNCYGYTAKTDCLFQLLNNFQQTLCVSLTNWYCGPDINIGNRLRTSLPLHG